MTAPQIPSAKSPNLKEISMLSSEIDILIWGFFGVWSLAFGISFIRRE
jgi:hypothetical protein